MNQAIESKNKALVLEAFDTLFNWRTVRAIDVTFNFSGGLLDLKG